MSSDILHFSDGACNRWRGKAYDSRALGQALKAKGPHGSAQLQVRPKATSVHPGVKHPKSSLESLGTWDERSCCREYARRLELGAYTGSAKYPRKDFSWGRRFLGHGLHLSGSMLSPEAQTQNPGAPVCSDVNSSPPGIPRYKQVGLHSCSRQVADLAFNHVSGGDLCSDDLPLCPPELIVPSGQARTLGVANLWSASIADA